MSKTAEFGRVQPWLNCKDHPRFEERVVAEIEERTFVITQADGVPRMVPPIGHEIVLVGGGHGPVVAVGAVVALGVLRLRSGRLVLIYNVLPARQELSLTFSDDDAKNWTKKAADDTGKATTSLEDTFLTLVANPVVAA